MRIIFRIYLPALLAIRCFAADPSTVSDQAKFPTLVDSRYRVLQGRVSPSGVQYVSVTAQEASTFTSSTLIQRLSPSINSSARGVVIDIDLGAKPLTIRTDSSLGIGTVRLTNPPPTQFNVATVLTGVQITVIK